MERTTQRLRQVRYTALARSNEAVHKEKFPFEFKLDHRVWLFCPDRREDTLLLTLRLTGTPARLHYLQ